MTPPLALTLAIATYNRADYLQRTLESLAQQTLDATRFEILVVNNNSTDATEAVFHRFAQTHPHLQTRMVIEPKQGISWVRNRCIAACRGEILVFLDDDEEAAPEFAQNYLHFFETHPEAQAAGGGVIPVYEAPLPPWCSPYIEKMITGALDMGSSIRPFRGSRYPGVGNSGFRRSLFDRYGVFDPALGRTGDNPMGGEEKDFFLRVRTHGVCYYYLPNVPIRHLTPAYKLTRDYFERLSLRIGVSEKVRTQRSGTGAYLRRIAMEGIKWGGASVLALGYLLRGRPLQSWGLWRMRWNITRGLLFGLDSQHP